MEEWLSSMYLLVHREELRSSLWAKVLWKPLPAIFYFLSCQDFATANKQKRLLPFAVRCAFHLLPSISRCGNRWYCVVVGDGSEVLLSATPQTQSFLGRMAERFIAAVLKTAVGKTTRGSNPFPSANFLPTRTPCFGGFSFADSLTREHSS